jgi:putative spermidine/putrescine transport system ATP-binding protein
MNGGSAGGSKDETLFLDLCPDSRVIDWPPASMSGGQQGASIRLEAIRRTYGSMAAVADVTADIAAGEFFTVVGPSGSGKTTLLQIIAGFVSPSHGELFIDGLPASGIPPQHRNLGMVFQSYALFPHLTVFENVAFPLRVRRLNAATIRQRVHEMLRLVRLEDLYGRRPHQLSGGQQQRVAVARALVHEPRALLMDEPLGALDKKLREQMQDELKQLQKGLGVTFVYVTHDQDEALRISDRIAVMHQGRFAQLGKPSEVYNRPASFFVADFLGESNVLRGFVVRHVSDDMVMIETDAGGQVRGTTAMALDPRARVVAMIRPERVLFGPASDPTRSVDGVVVDGVFGGDATRWRIRTAACGTLLVKEQNIPGRNARRTGDAVQVQWHPEDVRVFREDAE